MSEKQKKMGYIRTCNRVNVIPFQKNNVFLQKQPMVSDREVDSDVRMASSSWII